MDKEDWKSVKDLNENVKTNEKKIIDILLKYESELSDGYQYYAGSRDNVSMSAMTVLKNIAKEILDTLNK